MGDSLLGTFCLGSFTTTTGSVTGSSSATGDAGLAALISEISISIFDGCLILTGLTLGCFIALRAVRSSKARARALTSYSFFKSLIVYARLRLVVTAFNGSVTGPVSGLNSRAISDIGISLKGLQIYF